jgi:hypothetical protein
MTDNHLAIAGTWAAPFTLYYIILSGRIVAQRIKSEVFIGDNTTVPTLFLPISSRHTI